MPKSKLRDFIKKIGSQLKANRKNIVNKKPESYGAGHKKVHQSGNKNRIHTKGGVIESNWVNPHAVKP